MAKKIKPPEPGPNMAYLVSFGDTMTTLLAFFIVLNSLADEQTGANLHKGTGSFIRAMNGGGKPGAVTGNRTGKTVQNQSSSPAFVVADPDGQEFEGEATGPDDTNDQLPVIDREQDDFDRLMEQMEELATVKPDEETAGEAVFDFFNKMNPKPPYLQETYDDLFARVLPLLHQDSYQVEIIVWATTPSPTAWQRAAEQSASIRQQILQQGNVPTSGHSHLIGSGRPWFDSVIKRPVLSLVIRKM